MNYRHAYHAGNFADVVKHATVTRIVEYLKRKENAFRVIDTHAGTGLYDLSSGEAEKTGEWRSGIDRLLGAPLAPDVASLLAPYLEAVRAQNPDGTLSCYPGSPLIVRHLLRKQDRLSAIELHPQDASALKSLFDGDFQTRVLELDGWLALGAHLPPKEKRGLVLVDPPFEKEGEFERLVEGLQKAHRRWPGGIYALWYPIKDRGAVNRFRADLAGTGIGRILDIRFDVRQPSPQPRLDGTGMIVANPPFTLEAEMRTLLPALHTLLCESPRANWAMEWIAGEAPKSSKLKT
jgi:23S rRNA (adenine2030-N6)-methyltransferase